VFFCGTPCPRACRCMCIVDGVAMVCDYDCAIKPHIRCPVQYNSLKVAHVCLYDWRVENSACYEVSNPLPVGGAPCMDIARSATKSKI